MSARHVCRQSYVPMAQPVFNKTDAVDVGGMLHPPISRIEIQSGVCV
jgi:hypothetical protein